MLKAWKEMEEKASQCAQVGDVKEAALPLCEGDCDRDLMCLCCVPSVFQILTAVGTGISLQVHLKSLNGFGQKQQKSPDSIL